jgi:hypothetical protein
MPDDPIIRRGDDPPVKQPVVVRIVPGQPDPPPPPPGTTQYIVIQNILPPGGQNAASQGPAAPMPPIAAGGQFQAPPRPLYEQYARPRPRGRSKGTSALGAVSLALGVIAIAAYWLPGLAAATVPIAMIGFALAALGWVISILLGRSSAGVPFAGLIVCAIALGVSARGPGGWRDWAGRLRGSVKTTIDQSINATKQLPTAPAAVPPPPPATSAQSMTLRDVLAQVQAMFAAADARITKPTPTDAAHGPVPAQQFSPPQSLPLANPPRQAASPVAMALDHLNAARQAAQQRALAQPNVVIALADASNARQHLDQLRQGAPGTPELRDASTAWMQALQRVSDMLRTAVEADPQVIAARQQYVSAYEAQRAADRATAPHHSTTGPHGSGN